MNQFPLFLLVHVLGTSVCLATGLSHRPHLSGALGFTIGAAVLVALELVMLSLGVPVTAASGLVAIAVVTLACLGVVYRRGRPTAREWKVLGGWTVGFAVVAWVVTRQNMSLLTYDSHYMIVHGQMIASDGALAPGILPLLGDYGAFQVLVQSFVVFTGKSFIWAFTPMFALSTAVAFAVMLAEGLDALGARVRWRALAIGLVTLATFTVYMVFRHGFYIQTNFGTAAYILLFCALFWLAEVEGDAKRVPVACIAIFGIATHRIEGPLIALVFLTIAVLPSKLPKRAIVPPLACVAIVVAGWYIVLGNGALPTSEFLTPNRAYLMASVLVVFTAYVALSALGPLRFLEVINRRAPAILAVLFALALIAAFALRFDHMATSAIGWFKTLWRASYWEGGWLAIAALSLVGLFAPPTPHRWVFVVGVPANMALILLLVINRTPYYFGMGDSASRMAVHAVPLAFFYFGLKFLPLLAREPK